MTSLNSYERVARRKLKITDEAWTWCNLQRCGPDATKVEGGVPRLLKSGPRKGRPTWRDTKLDVCIVTDAEVAADRKEYEATTGNCFECTGTKQVCWSVSTEGRKYKACPRCNATGVAP